jgi:nucleoside-diphosphate-sugar epimerase
MKCLVTGGAGFIGSHLVNALEARGHSVRAFDNFSTGRRENTHDFKGPLLEGDVRDYSAIRSAIRGVDTVFHLAAIGSVARSVDDPLTTHEVNEGGTLNVLEACRREKVRRVVFASSSAIYGNLPKLPKHESAKPAPASPYAVSKLTGELYCRVFSNNFGLETSCVRYFNVFGPRQSPESEYAAVIPRFIEAALKGEEPVVYGDGTQTRDFTYVDNVVVATILAGSVRGAVGLVANVACGNRYSLLELISQLESVCGCSIRPLFNEARTGDVLHSQAAIGRARRALGYVPRIGLRRGLEETVRWFRKEMMPDSDFIGRQAS